MPRVATKKDLPSPKAVSKKQDQFTTALLNIEKSMGNKGKPPVIRRASEFVTSTNLKCISFGYPAVDLASFCNGVGRGKIVEIFGPESGGKSFLCLKLIASAQKDGLECCLVDAEKSFDPKWAAQHGVDSDKLWLINEDLTAEKTLDYVVEMCKSGQFGLIVVDSTAALVPEKELEGSIADQDYALLARCMSKGLKKIIQYGGSKSTTVVFINQIREKMGVMFGDSETTPGGRALKFYAHQRIKVSPGAVVKVQDGDKEVVVARKSWVKFVKNKVARPWGECTIEIIFDATSMNPVVKLANLAKAGGFKAIRMKDDEWTLTKDFAEVLAETSDKDVDTKKPISTGAKNAVEMANFLIKENMVIPLIKYLVEKKEDDTAGKLEKVKIDKEIIDLIENPSMIVSPDASVKFVAKGEVLESTPEAETETEDKEFAEKYDATATTDEA